MKRIVVPLDGTPLGEAILPHVAELARGLGAAVELVHVVPPSILGAVEKPPRTRPAPMLGAPSMVPGLSPSSSVLKYKYDPGEVETTRRYVERVATWLSGEGLTATAVVVEGADVAAEVLQRADQADLLAFAVSPKPTRSRQFGRLMIGSISDRLIRDARKPILFVRVEHAAR